MLLNQVRKCVQTFCFHCVFSKEMDINNFNFALTTNFFWLVENTNNSIGSIFLCYILSWNSLNLVFKMVSNSKVKIQFHSISINSKSLFFLAVLNTSRFFLLLFSLSNQYNYLDLVRVFGLQVLVNAIYIASSSRLYGWYPDP